MKKIAKKVTKKAGKKPVKKVVKKNPDKHVNPANVDYFEDTFKSVPLPLLTAEEVYKIEQAALLTWQHIANDARELGIKTKEEAFKLIYDSGKLINHGLNKELYKKLTDSDYNEVKILFNSLNWY